MARAPPSGIPRDDASALERCLRDIVALATLPAMWSGAAPVRIAESLAASLFTTLSPEFVYVGLAASARAPLLHVAQVDRYETSAALAAHVGPAIFAWSREHDPGELLMLPDRTGDKCHAIVTRAVGHGASWGAIGLALAPNSSAGPWHQLVLNVASTQAATAIHNAHLFHLQQEGAERLRAALHAANTGTFRWDIRAETVNWDESLERLFDLPRGESVLTLTDFITRAHPDDRAAIVAMCERSARDGADFDLEFRVVCRDGSIRWLHDKGKTFLDANGVPAYMTGACVDISHRKQAQEDREKLLESERAARNEAERANRLKDQFLATLSHELRTPLNAILGWSHILANSGGAEGRLEKGLSVIERNARLQAQLIDELLDMSRIVSGKLRLEVQPVDVAVVVRAAVESALPAAQAKGVNVSTFLEPDLGAVQADPGRLQQIVWNLLSNAVKFTPPGGHVDVSLDRQQSHVRFRVADTGAGIEASFLPCLFERFRQADSAATREHGGLGLGLAIVKNIVEMHGGRVHCASDGPGLGAAFTVELPLTQPAHAAAAASPRPAALPIALHPHLLDGLRVLVIDDEPDVRDLVTRMLEDWGAQVLVAAHTRAAFDHLERVRPDVILSDIGMPHEDGYSFMRRLRALPPSRGGDIPAAALTAFARDEDRARALEAGFQLHIVKPLDPADLALVVASLAGRVPSQA